MKFNLSKLSKDNLLFERLHPFGLLNEEGARQIIIKFKDKDGEDYIISMYNGRRVWGVTHSLDIAEEGKQYNSFYWEILPCDEEHETYLHISEIDEYINSIMIEKELILKQK